jgi:hypothetical protein
MEKTGKIGKKTGKIDRRRGYGGIFLAVGSPGAWGGRFTYFIWQKIL